MTNKEWLDYLAHNAPDELAAWFDAEHVETEERALDGDTAALNAKIAELERKLRISWEYECKFQAERDELKGQVFTLKSECDDLENELYELTAELDAAKQQISRFDAPKSVETSENPASKCEISDFEDSREQLEADIEEWASIMDLEDQIDTIHGWLNRRAQILEREMVKFNRRYFDCVEQEKKIAELTRKMEILKAHGVEIVDAVAGGYEVYNEKIREVSELQAQVDELKAERVKLRSQICKLEDDLVRASDERDNWKANCEDWKNHARAAENACYETMLEREDYRKKFGKCIDYADAIHALMDDEGLA